LERRAKFIRAAASKGVAISCTGVIRHACVFSDANANANADADDTRAD
jgi:hypothetical protein